MIANLKDQEELTRSISKLKDETLTDLLQDLNTMDEDPLNSLELKQLMHRRGIPMRFLGKLCTNSKFNHIREIAVIEIISRAAKLLIRDGLVFLSEDRDAGFTCKNINKCVTHYLHEIFNLVDEDKRNKLSSVQNIWDFISEHAKKKYNVSIEKDVLGKIHLPQLFMNIVSKLRIAIKVSPEDLDFSKIDPTTGKSCFLNEGDVIGVKPVIKDYREHSFKERDDHSFPVSINLIRNFARKMDEKGKKSKWYLEGGPERKEATELYRLLIRVGN